MFGTNHMVCVHRTIWCVCIVPSLMSCVLAWIVIEAVMIDVHDQTKLLIPPTPLPSLTVCDRCASQGISHLLTPAT